jgi:hypothetical protein
MGRDLLYFHLQHVDNIPSHSFTVGTSHMESEKSNAEKRIQQLTEAFETLLYSERSTANKLLVGDLNARDGEVKQVSDDLRAFYKDGWVESGKEKSKSITWKPLDKSFPGCRFDRLFIHLNGDVKLSTFTLAGTESVFQDHHGDQFPSDHFAIIASFSYEAAAVYPPLSRPISIAAATSSSSAATPKADMRSDNEAVRRARLARFESVNPPESILSSSTSAATTNTNTVVKKRQREDDEKEEPARRKANKVATNSSWSDSVVDLTEHNDDEKGSAPTGSICGATVQEGHHCRGPVLPTTNYSDTQADGGSVDVAMVMQLMEMGFDKDTCSLALRSANNDLDLALALLLSTV